jgi:hypothetical protein
MGKASKAPSLLSTAALLAEIGVLLRYEVLDQASESPIGSARRGTIWDLDRRPLAQLVGRDAHDRAIVHSLGEPFGWIDPAISRRWDKRTGPPSPRSWTGQVGLSRDGCAAARVRGSQMTDVRTKKPIAVLRVPPKKFGMLQHHDVWGLQFYDDPPRPVRIMALAWLLYSWRLQRNLDMSEAGTPLLWFHEPRTRRGGG